MQTKVTRTCVICRKTDEKKHLLRFVAVSMSVEDPALIPDRKVVDLKISENQVLGIQLDPECCAPGRGAYVHPTLDCLLNPKLSDLICWSFDAQRKRGKRKKKKQETEPAKVQKRQRSNLPEFNLLGFNILNVIEAALHNREIKNREGGHSVIAKGKKREVIELLTKLQKLCSDAKQHNRSKMLHPYGKPKIRF